MNSFDIEKIKRKTLAKYPLFGRIIVNIELIETTKTKTAGTDGKKIYFNPKFMSSLTEDEQIFVFAHEICHIALNHIERRVNKDRNLWNKATDAVINAYLENDGLSMPKDGVKIFGAINCDAEELYEKLIKEKKEKQNSKNNQGQDGEKQEEPNFDDHDIWDDENKLSEDLDDDVDNESSKKDNILKRIIKKLKGENKKDESSQEKENKQNEVREDIDEISSKGEKKTFEENKIKRQKNFDDMLKSLSDEQISHGESPGLQKINIGEIGTQRSIIDWRLLLRQAVNYEVDWSYQDAEIQDGVLTPSLYEMSIPETEILLDTSGSIDDELLRCFLRECKNIFIDSRIKVGCFDTKFYGFNEIKTEEDIDNMEFVGRGGTDFNAAVNAFSNRVENKIIFTDGKSDMPNKEIDAIWVVFGNEKINPLGGKVIYIDENKLRELYSFSVKSRKL